MSTTLNADQLPDRLDGARWEGPAVADPPRRAAGLTVLIDPAAPALRAAPVRRGAALALVPTVADPVAIGTAMGGVVLVPYDPDAAARAHEEAAERALVAVTGAGFAVHAVETLPPDALGARLRALDREDVSCVVVATRSAREARRLARAAGTPVLAVPPGAPRASGPAVLDARDAARAAPAAARCLSAGEALVVAAYDPLPAGTTVRAAGHPLLLPRLMEEADERRWDARRAAQEDARLAAGVAAEHGFAARSLVVAAPASPARVARERDGVVVVVDRGGWRAPRALREALAGGLPALVLPA